MVSHKRPDLPYQPAPVVAALRVARDAMLRSKFAVKPFGPASRAADVVIKAIDAFATLLTGEPRYFADDPHGGGHGPLGTLQDKLAREKGEKPWDL